MHLWKNIQEKGRKFELVGVILHTHLRPEKKGVRICESSSSANTKWRRRGRRFSIYWGWDSPVAQGAVHGGTVVSVQPLEGHVGADIHLLAVEETHSGADGCITGICDTVGTPQWSGLLWGTCVERSPRCSKLVDKICDAVIHSEIHSEAACSWRNGKGPTLKELQPVGMTYWRSLWRTGSCGRGPWNRGRTPLFEEKARVETMCDELTAMPIPYLPAPVGWKKVGSLE